MPDVPARSLTLPRIRISPETLVAVATVYFALACNSRFWSRFAASSGSGGTRTAIAVFAALVLVAGIHALLLLPFSSRHLLKPALAVLFAANAVAIHSIETFGVYVDASMIRNVLQTDAAEATELVSWGLARYLLLYAIVPGVVLLRIELVSAPLPRAVRRRALFLACAVAALGVAGLISFKEMSSFFRNDREARYLITPGNYVVSLVSVGLAEGRAAANERTPIGTDASLGSTWRSGERPMLLVLVVGETARAESFSLNGYGRETNPRLRAVPGLINFSDVSACGTSTAVSLPCMFSPFGRTSPKAKRAREFESLLDVVRRAGLEVTWLDNNSGCKGVCDGVESAIVGRGDWAPSCSTDECFDEVLLAGVDAKIGSGRSALLVLHQKGSHGPAYYRRYPSAFERFTPSCRSDDFADCTRDEIRNAYDNSILYTDHVLAEVIERLDAASGGVDTAMLYVSDHGESLGENGIYLHGLPYSMAPSAQTRVPMIFWASPQFAARLPMRLGELARAASSRHHSHDNLFHSVLGALDVRTEIYDARLDVFATGQHSVEPGTSLASAARHPDDGGITTNAR
ncbi:MAG: phosphoethanolamine transferase [Acidobacteria bacterium]|nr:phosphoethanolamine transferase [Acidobacteriota bacterium]